MTGKTKLAIYLLFSLLLLGGAVLNLKPAVGLQVDPDQTYTVQLFDQVESEDTLSTQHPLDTTKNPADLPGHNLLQDWPDGCGKKDYKKDVIAAPCGNAWGG